jgi:hypothetical protein
VGVVAALPPHAYPERDAFGFVMFGFPSLTAVVGIWRGWRWLLLPGFLAWCLVTLASVLLVLITTFEVWNRQRWANPAASVFFALFMFGCGGMAWLHFDLATGRRADSGRR